MSSNSSNNGRNIFLYVITAIIVPFLMNVFTSALQENVALKSYILPLGLMLLISAFFGYRVQEGLKPEDKSLRKPRTSKDTASDVWTTYDTSSSESNFSWLEWIYFALAIAGGVFGFAKGIIGGYGIIGAIAGFCGGFVGTIFAISLAIQYVPAILLLLLAFWILSFIFWGLQIIFK